MAEIETREDDVVEIELDEDRIVGYLVDEDDVEIGVLYKNDEGEEVEIYYDEIAVEDGGSESEDSSEEAVEMEIDPDSVLYYFVDAKGRELGFAAVNAEGKKEEYLYPDEAIERFFLLTELENKLKKASGVKGSATNLVNAGKDTVGGVVNRVAGKEVVKTSGENAIASNDDDDAVSRDDFKEMFSAFKDVAIEGYAAISGVMDQVDDVRDSLDEINPKKRRQNRREKKKAEAAKQPLVVQQVPAQQVQAQPTLDQQAPVNNETADANNVAPVAEPVTQQAAEPAPAAEPATQQVAEPASAPAAESANAVEASAASDMEA